MNWKKKRVVVTGAGGFIGSHLTERLVRLGARTRALVQYTSTGSAGWLDSSAAREHVEIVQGDVRDAEGVRKLVRQSDVVFHLAALIAIPYSYEAPLSYVRTNIEGTLNVLQAALEHGVERVVHTSTSEVYGTARRLPMDESHPLQGQSPYSATKIGADKLAEAFHLSFGLPVTTLRPFNTYGPRQSARAVIPTIITQVLTQRRVRLGSLSPRRDFTFVEDTADAFLHAASASGAVGRVLNAGTGEEIAIESLVARIMRLAGRTIPVATESRRRRPRGSEVERLRADARELRRLTSWKPRISLDEGLQRTIAWIRDHLDLYRPEDYAV